MSAAVRAGYKQTEVGVIPEDWAAKPLKRISPQQSVGLVINPSTYFDERGTVPMLVGSNIKENIIHWEDARRITEGSNHLISASRLAAGDLVTVRVGDPGLTAVVPPELDRCNCASVMIVRKHDTFDSHWLCSVMNSPWGRAQVANVQYGTAQKQFNISDAVNFTYAVPPLPEQQAIATALSDVDVLLAKLDALVAKKRDLKVAAMQQLLTGQTRLPGFSGEWERKEIGSQIDLLTGFPFPSIQYVDSGVRLLRGSNVKRGETDWHEDLVQFWPAVTQEIKRYELEADDLVIAMDGSLVGRSYARLTLEDLPAVLLQRVARIRSKALDVGFLTQVVGSEQFVQYCDSVKTVTAIPHISAADIRNFELALPPSREEQIAIATVLSDMDAELTALEARRDKTRALKQGMMQELLTGRIRLFSRGLDAN